MTKATYFTATNDEGASYALESTPDGNEVLSTVIAPGSDAFAALIRLIVGTQPDDPGTDPTVVHRVAQNADRSVVRLSADLIAEIADRDADEFGDLTRPWQRSGVLDSGETDVADFLIDLQHLSRNAVATKGAVYAVESR